MCCREGKSTLINELARAEGVFEVRSSTDTCTRGVDISTWCPEWSDFSLAPRDSREPQPRMVFADAEGTGCKDGDYDLQVSRRRHQEAGPCGTGCTQSQGQANLCNVKPLRRHLNATVEPDDGALVDVELGEPWAACVGDLSHMPLRSSQLGPTFAHALSLWYRPAVRPLCRSWYP